jgi:hypothetical protein
LRKDPTLLLQRAGKLNHASVRAALKELRSQVDPTIYCSVTTPESLTAARARHRART